jgi:ribosomal protein S18 acetylase RimI-like enzyme
MDMSESRSVRIDPLPPAEADTWIDGVRDRFTRPRISAGTWTSGSAPVAVAKLLARLMPEGAATDGHHVRAISADGARIGYAWLRISGPDAFVYDLVVTDRAYESQVAEALDTYAAGAGATVLRMNVFRDDANLARIVGGRGFAISNSQMRLPLDGVDPDRSRPDGVVELRPMAAEDFDAFVAAETVDYAEGLVRSRLAGSLAEALERSKSESAESLPDGVDTEGQRLLTAYADGVAIGTVWLEIGDPGSTAFVSDIHVRPDFRRRGHARRIMLAAERLCREAGVAVVGLSVFGFNEGARALYDQLGYMVTEEMLWKELPSS